MAREWAGGCYYSLTRVQEAGSPRARSAGQLCGVGAARRGLQDLPLEDVAQGGEARQERQVALRGVVGDDERRGR